MSKIKTIQIKNIKAVEEFNLPLDGATVVLTGGNNKWKSTILKCMIDRLRWEKPELILKDTTKNWLGEIELTDGNKFIWKILQDGEEEMLFITNDGRTLKASKDVRDIYFPKVFDIDDFLNKWPKDKLKDIKAITWLDLDIIEAKYKEAYDYRTIMRRIKDDAEAKRLNIDFWLPEQELSTEDLVSEIATIKYHNEKVDMINKSLSQKQERLDILRQEIISLGKEIEEETQWLSINKKREADQDITNKLEELREVNNSINQNNIAKKIENEYQDALTAWEDADKMVKDLEQEKRDQIAKAPIPEWFTIDNWALLYNWLPLERIQQSSSALYIAWLKLAKEMLWEVKTLHFDASFLDKNSLNDIWKWAQSEELQLMIERPDYDWWEITYKFLKS